MTGRYEMTGGGDVIGGGEDKMTGGGGGCEMAREGELCSPEKTFSINNSRHQFEANS